MRLTIRTATSQDRPRILEISAQIWEGEDDIPGVLDEWLDDEAGEMTVACLDERPIAFAFQSWLYPGYAWIQGIRTDPAFRGRGAGRAITEHFIARAGELGAARVGLSTHVDNRASIRIIESYGFRRIASYALVESTDRTAFEATKRASTAEPIRPDEAASFVRSSSYLRVANGRIPWIWKMYPFDGAWPFLVERLSYRRGVRRGGRLRSLVGVSPGSEAEPAFVSFLDGPPDDLGALLSRARDDLLPPRFVFMIPKSEEEEAPALGVLRQIGYRAWTDFEADVLHCELALVG
jgi:GNAT superfamily N-acetyltransferase